MPFTPFRGLVGSRHGAYLEFPDSLWKGNSPKFAKNNVLKVAKFIADSSLAARLYAFRGHKRRGQMAKTKHFGPLTAAAGALVAAALLVLVLVVVKPQPGRAAFPGTNGLIAYEGIDPIDGDWEIFAIHPDLGGRQGRQLTFNSLHTPDSNPCYSPDGNKIGYLGVPAKPLVNPYQIFTMPATGGQRLQVTPNTAKPLECSFTGPRGTHIVYSGYDGSDYEIFTIPADGVGGPPTQVTDNLDDDLTPSFTAVGRRIAYSGIDPTGNDREILTIPHNGGTPVQVTVTNRLPNVNPDYRPEGQRIVYLARLRGHLNGPLLDSEILTISATGGRPSRLTSNGSNDLDPVYSPNGQQIAYSSTGGVYGETSDYEIFTMPADGGQPVQVTFNNTNDRNPSWQPKLGIDEIRQVVDTVRNQREGRGTDGAEAR
jgi:Tol biopolymer transport system component